MTGAEVSRREIINHMKDHLNLSLKKVSSRIIVENQQRIGLFKIIFYFEFANILKSHLVIVNIEEVLCVIPQKKFSWGVRGSSTLVQNISFKGSQSLIDVITIRGGWFFSHLHSNNNSALFIDYFQHLIRWLTNEQNIDIYKMVLLMDNCWIHTS